ncbi:putative chloride channel, voltage gated, chloride channel, core [Helianthus annuus]|uniref:Chloride channel, voltage gated, chloride channel, core n=1 Tax=Helianthus annuus TaxID=4232 RepID=A0A9K3I8Q9_HELAN|nr:putative chloride channel, voltage gated, chloride channel, core [Helianthus annuus]KAF5792343.1 putative chloride channel, voltage gated, chloride channel, core [Helianthus annuus]KAJ0527293.1 putative chloride channel, voltage gated, chloride channel, core [Helianthus annuus]KAJ0535794.1 putative chloride channel, voltage gated, chloride channel, core [Helianthus annuus]KAJ0535969.1 putative chloride channel, voltage gated, chloride channel, core [Helianthus annuus]
MCWSSLCVYCPAAGSGIPEVKAYLNGVDAHSILAPSTLFVKIFGSIFGVAVGFVVGKEGPMVHMGACIANLLGQGASTKRDLITCGAAAGVAAAFRSPVGGALFALEEAASWWRSALLWKAFFTTVVVAVVLKGLIEYCKTGQCRLIGEDGLIMRDINNSVPSYNTIDLLAIVLLGVTGGVFRIIYNYLVDEVLSQWWLQH